MVKSFIKFSKGMLKLPAAIQIWLLVLMCLNMIVPFFLYKQVRSADHCRDVHGERHVHGYPDGGLRIYAAFRTRTYFVDSAYHLLMDPV